MNRPRKRKWVPWLAIAAATVILVPGVVVALRMIPGDSGRPEYPDAPFERVGPEFPRIIPLREPGFFGDDQVARFLTETGAIRNATPEEREAVRAVLGANGKPLYRRGEELARKILHAHPDSVPALYAMAQALHHEEVELPQALFDVRHARHVLEDRGRADPRDADGREWYLRVLVEEYSILRDLDRPQDELRVVELLEQVYEPLPWLKIFPLIKLKRLDEAERTIDAVEKGGGWPDEVLNSRPMLAEARRDRHGCYVGSKASAEASPFVSVLWYNHGLSCLNDFRFDEAEAAFQHAANLSEIRFYGSPSARLAVFYLQEGRMQEAWDALQRAKEERATQEPEVREQEWTFTNRSLALMMLAVGRGEDAERFARLAYEQPGRTGGTTDDQRTHTTLSGLVLWMALETRVEELQEADAARTGVEGLAPGSKVEIAERQAELWTLRRRLIDLLSDETFLSELIRPYLPGQDDKETWVTPTILRVLPPGVAVEAIRKARQAETDPNAAAYFDALEAEVDLIRGQPEDALRLAKQALDHLPEKAERFFRARAAAVGADAARQLGRANECRRLTGAALRDFPEVFRLLHLSIPVRIEDDGSPSARQLADALRRSPRFREDPAGFRVVLNSDSSRGGVTPPSRGGVTPPLLGGVTPPLLRFALFGADDQTAQFEAAVPLDGGKETAAALQRFHMRMMSPVLDLSDADVNTLAATPAKPNAAGPDVLK